MHANSNPTRGHYYSGRCECYNHVRREMITCRRRHTLLLYCCHDASPRRSSHSRFAMGSDYMPISCEAAEALTYLVVEYIIARVTRIGARQTLECLSLKAKLLRERLTTVHGWLLRQPKADARYHMSVVERCISQYILGNAICINHMLLCGRRFSRRG